MIKKMTLAGALLLVTVVTLASIQVSLSYVPPPPPPRKITDYALARRQVTIPLTDQTPQTLTITVASTKGPFFLVQLQLFYGVFLDIPYSDLELRKISIDNSIAEPVLCPLSDLPILITNPHTYGEILSTLSCDPTPYKVTEPMGNVAVVASSSIAFQISWPAGTPSSLVSLTAIATVTVPTSSSVTITIA